MADANATSIQGLMQKNPFVCQNPTSINSKGVWFGDSPFSFSAPLLLVQFCLVFVTTKTAAFFLRPLGQPLIISQILGGIILGPTILGRSKTFTAHIFPTTGTLVLDTVAWFGVMFFYFLEGVKMDLTAVRQSGRKAMAIGVLAFLLPLVISISISLILRRFLPMDPGLAQSLPMIAASQSLTPFIVLSCLLAEFKILNTELGRLGLSSSVYGDVSGITLAMIGFSMLQNTGGNILTPLWSILSSITLVVFIMYVIRPAMLWLSKQTPEGKPVHDLHLFVVIVGVLVAGLVSMIIGQNMILGPLVLGLATPDGPPLGSALVEKFDTLVSGLFLPTFFAVSGMRTDFSSLHPNSTWIVGLIVISACLARFVAVLLPALVYNIPMRDVLVLGLMLNSKGIIELVTYNLMKQEKALGEQEFSVTVMTMMVVTIISTPLIRLLYSPSQRYLTTKKRTIQHLKRGAEARILVCIHNQENVPTMVNLLEVSHPSREGPISVLVLNLVELVGRTSPILIAHQTMLPTRSCSTATSSHIFNAFRHFELNSRGFVTVQPFTAVSHVATMHDDVCQVALDRRVAIVIVPFHKQWAIDGTVGSVNPGIRTMNRNILDMAPCSVGILVDRGILRGSMCVLRGRSPLYRVTVLLMDGDDDGEALAYGARMARHPTVKLTVVRFLAVGGDNDDRDGDFIGDAINEFKLNKEVSGGTEFREEVVRDGERLASVIRGMLEEGNDLMIVGRHHRKDSPLFSGLTEWNECPELGIVGDMLASPDFGTTSSVLVVQQQLRHHQQARAERGGFTFVDGSRQPLEARVSEPMIRDGPMREDDTWTISMGKCIKI